MTFLAIWLGNPTTSETGSPRASPYEPRTTGHNKKSSRKMRELFSMVNRLNVHSNLFTFFINHFVCSKYVA